MIRLWHQSISELDHLPQYAQMLQSHAARVVDADTKLDVHGLRTGTYPPGIAPIDVLSSPWCHYLANVQIVENAIAAERLGYDAVVITCFHDPVLHEARSMVDIPVVSMCESALLTASTIGDSLGLIGIGPANANLVRGLVHRYGFDRRVTAVIELETPVNEHEIDASFASASPLTESFLTAARAVIAAGADVIVPSESLLNTALVKQGVREVDGVPVVDAFAVMLAHAEMLVRVRRATGLQISRTAHPRPDAASLGQMRAATAAVLSGD